MSALDAGIDPTEQGRGALWLLRRNRAFRSLWIARTICVAGDSVSLVALMLHVADTAGQAIAVSVLLLVGDFVPSLFGPLAGAITDRFNMKRVMIACELIQGALILTIAFALPSLPVLLLLVAFRALAGQVFQPASRAAVPALVPGKDLETANSAIGLGTNGSEAAGPLIAAALFPLIGVQGVLLVDAASFVLSAVVLAGLPSLPAGAKVGGERTSLLGSARVGLRYLWSVRAVRIISLGFFAIVAFNGVDDVALVVLAKETFGAGDSAVALLLGGVGIGLLVGYALLSRYGPGVSMVLLLVAGFAISSIGNMLTGVAWAVTAAFALQTIRGLGIAAMDIASNTLLQRLVPAGMLGRVFGNLYAGIGVAAALSYVAGGLLLDATSAPFTLLIAGGGGTLATILVAMRLPRAVREHRAAHEAKTAQADDVGG
jgi:MFS family permease